MDNEAVLEIIKTIGILASLVISGIISIRLAKLTHHINSRMDQLLVEAKSASKAEGKVEGNAEGKEKRREDDVSIQDAAKLKITSGEINVTSEKKKK